MFIIIIIDRINAMPPLNTSSSPPLPGLVLVQPFSISTFRYSSFLPLNHLDSQLQFARIVSCQPLFASTKGHRDHLETRKWTDLRLNVV